MDVLKHSIFSSVRIIQQSSEKNSGGNAKVGCFFESSHQWWVFPQIRNKFLTRYYFLFAPSPKKVILEPQKIYCSFMQSTSSVTALVLRSKSMLDFLPLYVDLHLNSMIFLKYFIVLFFTVTKHTVFIMLLLMAMHLTM